MKQRGSAFILALVAIVVLAAVLATAAANTRTMLKGQAHRIDEQRAGRMAEAAIQFAHAQTLAADPPPVPYPADCARPGGSGGSTPRPVGTPFRERPHVMLAHGVGGERLAKDCIRHMRFLAAKPEQFIEHRDKKDMSADESGDRVPGHAKHLLICHPAK